MTGLRSSILAAGLSLWAGMTGAQGYTAGEGAVLRLLDKVAGSAQDFEIRPGQVAEIGRVQVELSECRYPEGNEAGEAFAYITVREKDVAAPVFLGWMIASAPALHGLEHPRYDVWALRCKT